MAKKAVKNKRGKKRSGSFQIALIFGVLASIIFLPTTIMLCVGMLPTIVAAMTDRSKKKSRGVTVGAMNLAGCSPFLLELWMQGHSFEKSFSIIQDPTAIIVMYSAAGVGYLIDWAMVGIVASILYQRGVSRQKAIIKTQESLVERWGPEVRGDLQLDQDGFAVKQDDPAKKPERKNPARR